MLLSFCKRSLSLSLLSLIFLYFRELLHFLLKSIEFTRCFWTLDTAYVMRMLLFLSLFAFLNHLFKRPFDRQLTYFDLPSRRLDLFLLRVVFPVRSTLGDLVHSRATSVTWNISFKFDWLGLLFVRETTVGMIFPSNMILSHDFTLLSKLLQCFLNFYLRKLWLRHIWIQSMQSIFLLLLTSKPLYINTFVQGSCICESFRRSHINDRALR